MNNQQISAILIMALTPMAYGAEYWVDGVTKESGWYDANKTPIEDEYGFQEWNPDEEKGDVRICHAATAANLVGWWQDRYKSQLPTGVPTTAQDIWNTYKNNQICDSGGQICYSFQWWLTGIHHPTTDAEAARTRDGLTTGDIAFQATGGFYYDSYLSQYASGEYDATTKADTGISSMLKDLISEHNGERIDGVLQNISFDAASSVLIDAINNGMGIGLDLQYYNGLHSLTLWGLETNDNGVINKLWLTDSDDSIDSYGGFTDPSLFYVYVAEENGEMVIQNHGANNYSEDSDRGLDAFILNGITTINPSVTNAWFAAVPEPATATLSLLALAALATRRRRSA